MSDKALINFKLLEEYENMLGLEVLHQMTKLYEESFQVYLEEIQQALSENCCRTWHDHCHRLKGATSSMGFIRFTYYLNQIEHKQLSERIQNPYIKMIIEHHNTALDELKSWLATR